MRKLLSISILVTFSSHALAAQPLPSDEEMMRQGRATIGKVGDLDALFKKAQRNSAMPMQPTEVPKESLPNEYQSPLMKELAKDAFNTDIRKEIAKDAATKNGSDLVVFVSFSMPDDMLASYSAQAKEAGATLVLRGMVERSVSKTQLRAIQLNKPLASWDINPGLFRKFNIQRVPSIVLADSKEGQVIEDGCARPSAYLEVDGAISIRQALLLMRSRGDGGLAKDAGRRLEKLEKN